MRTRFTRLITLCMLLATSLAVARAQLTDVKQKRFARVTQEFLKEGNWPEYQKIQAERADLLAAANWPRVSIALVPLFGSNQVLHYSFFDTFSDLKGEQADLDNQPGLKAKLKALDERESTLLVSKRTFLTTYHPNISYQGDFSWPEVRYTSIIFIHLHPGHGDEYLANRKIVLAAHSGAHLTENLALYTTFAGGPSSSYWIIRPVKSLPEFDEMDAMHGDAYGTVLGDANRKSVHELFAASVETEEEDYFKAAPELSYATKEWAGSDAEFWVSKK